MQGLCMSWANPARSKSTIDQHRRERSSHGGGRGDGRDSFEAPEKCYTITRPVDLPVGSAASSEIVWGLRAWARRLGLVWPLAWRQPARRGIAKGCPFGLDACLAAGTDVVDSILLTAGLGYACRSQRERRARKEGAERGRCQELIERRAGGRRPYRALDSGGEECHARLGARRWSCIRCEVCDRRASRLRVDLQVPPQACFVSLLMPPGELLPQPKARRGDVRLGNMPAEEKETVSALPLWNPLWKGRRRKSSVLADRDGVLLASTPVGSSGHIHITHDIIHEPARRGEGKGDEGPHPTPIARLRVE